MLTWEIKDKKFVEYEMRSTKNCRCGYAKKGYAVDARCL